MLGLLEPHLGGAVRVGGLGDRHESCIGGVADLLGRGVNCATAFGERYAQQAKEHVIRSLVLWVSLVASALEPLGVVSLAVCCGDLGTTVGNGQTVHIDVRLLTSLLAPLLEKTSCHSVAVDRARS